MTQLNIVCDLKDCLAEIIEKNGTCSQDLFDWKLLGQEQGGNLLVSWKQRSSDNSNVSTNIAYLDPSAESLELLISLNSDENLIQASTNPSKTFVLFTKKVKCSDENYKYSLNFALASPEAGLDVQPFCVESSRQIMAQFLYRSKPSNDSERFLVFVHKMSIALYRVNQTGNELSCQIIDEIIKSFSWAQWDAAGQSLFYIHYKKPTQRDDGEERDSSQSPTLSALQFNDNTPHETVLNIPLNLPPPVLEDSCNTYDDVPIPLKVHDCALDVTVLSDDRGVVCICHNYLFQPVQAPTIGLDVVEESSTVHMAYSVTLLHHGLVIHTTLPGIPWSLAHEMKPIFCLHKDDYLIVYLRGLFVHLLDMSPGHEPCCHIILPHSSQNDDQWAPLKYFETDTSLVNLKTLQVFNLEICPKALLDAYFDRQLGLSNKLSIIHYFLVHKYNFDAICELLRTVAESCLDAKIPNVFHEVLIGGAYASVHKTLPEDGIKLMRFLPLTTMNPLCPVETKVNDRVMTWKQEALWNPAVMLLAPRQRLCQFRVDHWTKLWDLIAQTSAISRFKPTTVVEKLTVSLFCYQPEALSRCSTPLSPGSGLSVNSTLSEMTTSGNYRVKPILPFYEIEKCTASKQEHVISVNLRELSIHLVKHGLENPLQVHVVATRYAAAQLEMSRFLCSIITNSTGLVVQLVKGFQLVNELPMRKRRVLFLVMERYAVAVDTVAYPTPQGFASFFTYLAYKSMEFEKFVQYVQANSLQLQIDVMKVIFTELGDDSQGAKNKLKLLHLLPRSRARRLLNQWSHPVSLMLRAREHASNILSGVETRTHRQKPVNQNLSGLTSVSADRYSPLDTFLDLLTAKASLAELDFNLLVEATLSSSGGFSMK